MIIGIGCDIIEVQRIEKAVQSESFKQRVFTTAEIAYCESRGKQQYASFAARFAAKEAVLKALGTGLRGGALTEIEVLNDELGCPKLHLHGYHLDLACSKGASSWHLTLSHSKETAMAYVVLEGTGQAINLLKLEKFKEEYAEEVYPLTAEIVHDLLPLRQVDAHKGDAGRVVVVAGSPGFLGAAALASHAAVKAGAGLVSLLTPAGSYPLLAIKLNEEMVHALPESEAGVLAEAAVQEILQKAEAADVLAIGPGLGTSAKTQEVVREVLLKITTPVVIDADALTALKGHLDVLKDMQAPKVLTPHAGEMARLLEISAEEVNADRINLAQKAAVVWNAVVVLKGAQTVIACPNGSVYVNTTGCNAMATGGSGDVLTGIIAALAAQGISMEEAALCGVYLHGLAGELATERSIGLAAGEISLALPQARQLVELYEG